MTRGQRPASAGEALPRALEVSSLTVPDEVRQLDDEWLVWRWRAFAGSARGKRVEPTGLLERFINIRDARSTLAFMRRCGPIGFCQHAIPCCHAGFPSGGRLLDPERPDGGVSVVTPPRPEAFYCPPQALGRGWFGEKISWWLGLANVMRAAVDIASRLKHAERPLRTDLAVLRQNLSHGVSTKNPVIERVVAADLDIFGLRDGEGPIDTSRAQAWSALLELLNSWLQACPVRLFFSFSDTAPHRVDLGMSAVVGDQRGCFAALIFELVRRVRGDEDQFMARCFHCSDPFVPRHEPRSGQRAFCPACRGRGWPVRYAQRDRYAKKRDEILRLRKVKRQARSKERG